MTINIPTSMIQRIDRVETDRDKFVYEAVHRELERRRQDSLRQSLGDPRAEATELAEVGLVDWARHLPEDDVARLLGLLKEHPRAVDARRGLD